jgi:micrococcal nuclease
VVMFRPQVLGGGVAITAAALIAGCAEPAPRDGLAVVTHVVDGDTIDVAIGGRDERVRLIGIDTPETKKPDSPVECFGPEASSFTAELLPIGIEIRIERDIVGRDDYGRLLGYVHRLQDGLFVNLEIIERGYAQPLTIEPNSSFAGAFAAAARDAERNDRGMWAACTGTAR